MSNLPCNHSPVGNIKAKHAIANHKPAMQDGVSPSTVYLPENGAIGNAHHYLSILDFLIAKFPTISAEIWHQRIAQQKIFDANGQPIHQHTKYASHTKVYYYRELAKEIPVPFEAKILFKNEHLLVVDKPHFLAVSPTGRYVKETLLVRLKQQLNNPDISPIHRLDRETAGVIIFSLQPGTRAQYHKLFEQHEVKKTYHAIARHQPELQFPLTYQSHMTKGNPFFVMKEIDEPANSFTQIDLLKVNNDLALYELKPISGKQHQLRVHMAALGMPILNDSFYPEIQFKNDNDFSLPLQLLAKTIEFIDPVSQQKVCYYSEQDLHF